MNKSKITKDEMKKAIDNIACQFVIHLKVGPKDDPAIFHYNRLMSLGLDRNDAIRKVACVSAIFQLGKTAGIEVSSDVIGKMYKALPDSDAEMYLYKMCK